VVNWWGSWPARSQRGWNVSERYYYKRASGAPQQDETYPPELFSQFPPPAGATPSGPALDRFYMNIFHKQLRSSPVRVAALYLPGLDILNYEFFQRRAMDPFDYTEQYRAHLHRLSEEVRALSMENPGAHILILFHQGRSLIGDHSGILVESGRGAKSVGGLGFAEADVVPLILHTCGLPIAQSMSPALIRAVDPLSAPRVVAAFPKREEVESGRVDDFNDLLVEQMKSLGYLQ
jgi:hypothetical protein